MITLSPVVPAMDKTGCNYIFEKPVPELDTAERQTTGKTLYTTCKFIKVFSALGKTFFSLGSSSFAR